MSPSKIAWAAGNPVLCERIERALEIALARPDPIQTNVRRTLHRLRLLPSRDSKTTSKSASDPSRSSPLQVVVKFHHRRTGLRGFRDPLNRLLRRSPARREWDALQEITALGLPGPTAVAWGRTTAGEEILVTVFLEGRPLRDALAEMAPLEAAQAARDLAHSIRRLHEAGRTHGDLHLGNLLYSDQRIFMLDPGRLRRSRRDLQTLADWARLDSSLARAASGVASVECARALEAFRLALRRASGSSSGLDAARIAFDLDYQRGRARRVLKRGRRWKSVRLIPGVSGLAEVGVDEAALRASYAEVEAAGGASSRRGGRVRLSESVIRDTRVLVKRVEAGGPGRALADHFRGSAGARAFRRGQAALLLNHACARPIAFVEKRRMGFPVTSWLWMEKVGEADLDESLASDPKSALRVARLLGDWLGELHAAGFRHRDLKASNLRVTVSPEDVRFWLVDLEDLDGLARPSQTESIEALAQLNASVAEEHMSTAARIAALEAYAARVSLDRPLEKIARDVAERSRARRHRWKGDDCGQS